jgi:predicted dehydrogenase
MPQDRDFTRRDLIKAAGAVTAVTAAPFIQTVKAANDQVQYGIIGSGSRGTYLMKHLKNIETGRCVAICDIRPAALAHGVETIGNNPATYSDYHELLNRKDLDAVFVITPLFTHYKITRDVLQSGRNVFCG